MLLPAATPFAPSEGLKTTTVGALVSARVMRGRIFLV
jgi:hypothetical protein